MIISPNVTIKILLVFKYKNRRVNLDINFKILKKKIWF